MVRRVLSVVALICGLGWSSIVNAAILQVDANGILTGATGVNVAGSLYDVQFIDGSCIAIFSGCDEESDFDFADAAAGHVAAQALLDQVFINQFDTDSQLISGCFSLGQCVAFIPTDLGVTTPLPLVDGVSVTNNGTANPFVGNSDRIDPFSAFRVFDSASNSLSVYADFSPAAVAQPVPEPASLILLGAGLAGIVTRVRARTRQRRE